MKECLPVAERTMAFIKENMWDPSTRTLTRIWKDGKGAKAQAEDYSSLIKGQSGCTGTHSRAKLNIGALDLYEATNREKHALFAYDLQLRQNELFWDTEYKGYFVSAEDPTIIIRLKDGLVS